MAASPRRVPYLSSAASLGRTALVWLLGMILTAAVTAFVTYKYNQKANSELVVQQQRMADLQQFRASGALMEQGLSKLSDALVDQKGVPAAQAEMRIAIAKNITDAAAVEHILGPETKAYIAELARYRTVVDEVEQDGGQQLWRDGLKLMAHRRKLLKDADNKAALIQS